MKIIDTSPLTLNGGIYIAGNEQASNVTVYTSERNDCSMLDMEINDKANNKLTFSGHFYIRSNGDIYQGRPIEVLGEFAYNIDKSIDLNFKNIGVCLEGNFNIEFLQDIQRLALFQLFDYLKSTYNKNMRLVYLRQLDYKNNPGIVFPFGEVYKYYNSTYSINKILVGDLRFDSFASRELYVDIANPINGTDVYAVQLLLNKLGYYNGKFDGVYNSAVEQAVRNYQLSRDLKGTGITGYTTLNRMQSDIQKVYDSNVFIRILKKSLLDSDLQGEDILALQKELNIKMFYCEENSIYDAVTSNAVKQFQEANKIAIDGNVGPITWDAIFSNKISSDFRVLMLTSSNIMYGIDIKILQERLCILGYILPITSRFDGVTESQIRSYQIQKNFVNRDGIVTIDVWNKIFATNQDPL